MEAVDLTYRTDLRELNELNFARFDAKLELDTKSAALLCGTIRIKPVCAS
jgi:hypothetical protein